MAIEFFQIRENDFDLIYDLYDMEEQLHPNRRPDFFELYSHIRYGRVYAALDGEEVVGCVYFSRDFDNPSKAFLRGVTVVPEFRGKKLAESLMLSAFADIKEAGVRMVEVMVNPKNIKATNVYRDQLGFNIINVPDDLDLEEEEFLILRKPL